MCTISRLLKWLLHPSVCTFQTLGVHLQPVAAGVSSAAVEEYFPSLSSSYLPASLHCVSYLAASTQREPCSSSEPVEYWRPFGSAQPATHPGNVTSQAFLRLLWSIECTALVSHGCAVSLGQLLNKSSYTLKTQTGC